MDMGEDANVLESPLSGSIHPKGCHYGILSRDENFRLEAVFFGLLATAHGRGLQPGIYYCYH